MSEDVDKLHNDINNAVYRSKELLGQKLSAHDVWVKVKNEKLSDEQYKQLLIDNGIVISKK